MCEKEIPDDFIENNDWEKVKTIMRVKVNEQRPFDKPVSESSWLVVSPSFPCTPFPTASGHTCESRAIRVEARSLQTLAAQAGLWLSEDT